MDCINKILVNAIVHNDWIISDPLVCFYDDRLKITKDEFFKCISSPRNTVLMRIF